MNCPEHKVFCAGGTLACLSCWMYWRDVPRERIPLSVWLNPLRYEIHLVVRGRTWLRINRAGQWANRVPWSAVQRWNRKMLNKERTP